MTNLLDTPKIQAMIDTFVGDLHSMIHRLVIEAVESALGGAKVPVVAARIAPKERKVKAPRRAKRSAKKVVESASVKTVESASVKTVEPAIEAALKKAAKKAKKAAKKKKVAPVVVVTDAATTTAPTPDQAPTKKKRAEVNPKEILKALKAHDGNASAAARSLGLNRSTVTKYRDGLTAVVVTT